jgi:Leucine-rich repeat (LRR) protein
LGGKLYSIPAGISKLKNLTHLYVDYDLYSIPDEIFQCTELVDLELHIGASATIPNSFSSLTNLKNLTITGSSNGAEPMTREIPSTISNLSKLTNLTLTNLGIEDFGTHVTKLGELSYLNLKINKIKSFTPALSNLKKLSYLELDDNPISDFHPVIVQMPELLTISLVNTKIQTIDQSLLKQLKKITFILDMTPFGEWLQSEKGEQFRNFYDQKDIYFQPYMDPGGC